MIGVKLLFKQMLAYHNLGPRKHIFITFLSEFALFFLPQKYARICRVQKASMLSKHQFVKGFNCPTHVNSRDILFDPVFQMIETIERVWFVMNVGFRLNSNLSPLLDKICIVGYKIFTYGVRYCTLGHDLFENIQLSLSACSLDTESCEHVCAECNAVIAWSPSNQL